jgi:hypothetical protein
LQEDHDDEVLADGDLAHLWLVGILLRIYHYIIPILLSFTARISCSPAPNLAFAFWRGRGSP